MGYLYTQRVPGSDSFRAQATFEEAVSLYEFDRGPSRPGNGGHWPYRGRNADRAHVSLCPCLWRLRPLGAA
ncbi:MULTISPECIES: hypothetical protein [Stenotrophomonas maltophilia group]|uniref:hypothetical protein n=1 Tax=Stenotrophomonas maltophilia group TaxID=995085 RepID=UPI0023795BD0|nr:MULTISPECIES: hypothetical protein [Stenotrophomonas maltophilia group]